MGDLAEVRPLLSMVQRQVLDCIRDHVRSYGYPPTIRHIGAQVGVSSTSSVVHQIRQLEQKGYLQRDPYRQRALRVVDGGPEDSRVPAAIGRSSTTWSTPGTSSPARTSGMCR
nr:hypothetical protein [Pseudonocardia sp. AL041005-10]